MGSHAKVVITDYDGRSHSYVRFLDGPDRYFAYNETIPDAVLEEVAAIAANRQPGAREWG